MINSNRKKDSIISRMLILLVMSLFLNVERACAQEKKSETYALTIHYADGKMKKFEELFNHQLVSEKDKVFLSLILKDGRRFLIAVNDQEFEFSKELSQIIEAESKKDTGKNNK